MRTDSQPSAVSRLRAGAARAGRWVGGRGRWTRAWVVVGLVALTVPLIYLSLPNVEEPLWLYANKRFSQDAAQAVETALAAEDIQVFKDREGHLGVRPSVWNKAMAALRKSKVEPPSLDEIEKAYQTPNLWETSDQREQRLHWGMEHRVEVMIERLADIRSAHVTVQREKVRGGLRPEWKYTGFVYIETDGSHEISPRSVKSIQALLVANFNGLKPDAVSVSDRSGKFYLEAGNPIGGLISHTLARADELRESIVERLSYIKGLDVLVQMEPAAPEPTPVVQAPVPAKPIIRQIPAAETLANHPIELGPDPTSSAFSQANPATVSTVAALPKIPEPAMPKAKVWVRVPRSYYIDAFLENNPNKQPTPEELTPYVVRTEGQIRDTVTALVPARELDIVKIATIPDSPIGPRLVATPLPAPEALLQGWPAWVPGAAVGAAVGLATVVAVGVGFGLFAGRRPKTAPRSPLRRGGISVDPPGEAVHGPSERVRDLVRADPEAAAGVLHRWIGRDGGGSRS